jgi:hypothetical protein
MRSLTETQVTDNFLLKREVFHIIFGWRFISELYDGARAEIRTLCARPFSTIWVGSKGREFFI